MTEKQPQQPSVKDHSSSVAFYSRNEQLVRENLIAIEWMNIVRERLAHCARSEGLNQFVNCKELREQYMDIVNDRYKGAIFPEGCEPLNRTVPGLILKKD
mmetsp:Transcript_32297/g.30793  ORF Transcript_32297/g.30793 Transcript_32297/m.30793 type:complete len:100 (-) Transcript_32297:317-616(-)